MGNASRHLAIGGARPSFGKPIDAAKAALEFATEVLSRSVSAPGAVEPALERFRLRARAQEITFWLINATTASCLVRAAERHTAHPLPIVTLTDGGSAAERLRRLGVVMCSAGEISGVEELAPSGNSYAVFAVSDASDVVGALAIGWDASILPCDDSASANCRLAAAALLRSLSPARVTTAAQRIGEQLFDGLVDAIPMPIWVHGSDGRVMHGNTSWRAIADDLRGDADALHWTDVFHPNDRAAAATAFETAAAARRPFSIELRILAANGTHRSAVCHGAPYAGVDGATRGYVGCCCDISAQRQAERALTEIGSKLLYAQEEERSRIARELHDDLGQQTALLATQIDTLRRNSRTRSMRLRHGIAEASRGIQDLAVSIHNLSHELHPPKLKLLGLVKTLESLCRNMSRSNEPQVTFTSDHIRPDVPERTSLCLCRVAQEALQNAMKHSAATRIDVRLTATAQELSLRIDDNGRGFDQSSSTAGIGLVNMRERVELNGGRLVIHSSSGGTMVDAALPIAQS
jgi:PAS domain S-box-containing protein